MYNVVLTYEFVNESMTIQMKATEQYVLSCGIVYYAVQDGSNFWDCEWSVHSNESYWTALYC